VFDADQPFTPRGCIAQAWSVAEVLRASVALARREQNDPAERVPYREAGISLATLVEQGE